MKKEFLTEAEAAKSRIVTEKLRGLPEFLRDYVSYLDNEGYSFLTINIHINALLTLRKIIIQEKDLDEVTRDDMCDVSDSIVEAYIQTPVMKKRIRDVSGTPSANTTYSRKAALKLFRKWALSERDKEKMDNRRDKAVEIFGQHMHCSQSVLAAYADECGITEEQAYLLGSCFGSGMRKGEVCGACIGALMVLGMLYGQSHIGDQEGRDRSDKVDVMFMDRFKEANGSYICNDLLGYDVSTPEGAGKAREEGLFRDFCPKMVASAVDILEGIRSELSDDGD